MKPIVKWIEGCILQMCSESALLFYAAEVKNPYFLEESFHWHSFGLSDYIVQ